MHTLLGSTTNEQQVLHDLNIVSLNQRSRLLTAQHWWWAFADNTDALPDQAKPSYLDPKHGPSLKYFLRDPIPVHVIRVFFFK